MLRIHFNTGTAWTKSIDVEGNTHDDILELIDEYYREHRELPVRLYSITDIEEMYDCDMEEVNRVLEEMIPINGGEYYIEDISWVEEI